MDLFQTLIFLLGPMAGVFSPFEILSRLRSLRARSEDGFCTLERSGDEQLGWVEEIFYLILEPIIFREHSRRDGIRVEHSWRDYA